jgi:hypothetical protein
MKSNALSLMLLAASTLSFGAVKEPKEIKTELTEGEYQQWIDGLISAIGSGGVGVGSGGSGSSGAAAAGAAAGGGTAGAVAGAAAAGAGAASGAGADGGGTSGGISGDW